MSDPWIIVLPEAPGQLPSPEEVDAASDDDDDVGVGGPGLNPPSDSINLAISRQSIPE